MQRGRPPERQLPALDRVAHICPRPACRRAFPVMQSHSPSPPPWLFWLKMPSSPWGPSGCR
eukprot:4192339-Pyramimonas_sp.AAC.1